MYLLVPQDALVEQAIGLSTQAPETHVWSAVQVVFNVAVVESEQAELEVPGLVQV